SSTSRSVGSARTRTSAASSCARRAPPCSPPTPSSTSASSPTTTRSCASRPTSSPGARRRASSTPATPRCSPACSARSSPPTRRSTRRSSPTPPTRKIGSPSRRCASSSTAPSCADGAGASPSGGGRQLPQLDALPLPLEAALVVAADRHVVAGHLGPQRADRAPLLRPVGERVERVPPQRVLVGDGVHLVVGHVGHHRGELLGRPRPRRVRVRVVALPGDVAHADVVAQADADLVRDEAGEEVLAEDLRRL